jgi:3',5'-cyclic AMP phosphodiesterase CpdA
LHENEFPGKGTLMLSSSTQATVLLLWLCASCVSQPEIQDAETDVLRVIAIGDAGEKNSELRANAGLIDRLHTGQHDAGRPDMLIFLGDNFYGTGLNLPVNDVEGKVKDILGPFQDVLDALGRERVHAVAGNHDYYTGYALESSMLFGIIDIELGPVGLSDRGNERARNLSQWTYHYDMPSQAMLSISAGSGDSVQFIFFDSARLLRTDQSRWGPALDSLSRILSRSAGRDGIRWRVFVAHHPFFSLGEHGGYSVWNDETERVEYLTPCDKDSNAVGWLKNFLDPEDLCADRYAAYMDSVRGVIARSNVGINLILSGHEHSLQLLSVPPGAAECSGCPGIQIVSGAGSKAEKVRQPEPPDSFTAFRKDKQGISEPGFTIIEFSRDLMRVTFFNGKKVEPLDMGNGQSEFWIDRNGTISSE